MKHPKMRLILPFILCLATQLAQAYVSVDLPLDPVLTPIPGPITSCHYNTSGQPDYCVTSDGNTIMIFHVTYDVSVDLQGTFTFESKP